MEDEVENPNKSATILCVQYLISRHMKNKSAIKKDNLMKTVFKGRVHRKKYDKVMEDVSKTLTNIFGFSILHIDSKQFIIVNNLDKMPGVSYSSSGHLNYSVLLKPIIMALVMHQKSISEGQMWNMMEKLATKMNLDMNIVKTTVEKDFVRDHYLLFKATDGTTAEFDQEGTSHWFSMGPRALAECDQKAALKRVSELYNEPETSFLRVYSALYVSDNSNKD